ncbi:MAG: adenine phosphoribosyltransferase [Deltaproteobacteria bacterium]|nr:adenine phosphoribosyltransferase [Deltaproteobacteria bacterium]
MDPGASRVEENFAVSITDFIRTIPDFPKPGVQYRDITTLLGNPEGLRLAVDTIVEHYVDTGITCIAGIEARGFIFGTAVAYKMGLGFVPLRKPGKLPGEVIGMDYQLEYGEDRLELHADALEPQANVLLIDDLIATGGTAVTAANLIHQTGASIGGCCFVIDLPDLGGMERLRAMGIDCISLCEYSGD